MTLQEVKRVPIKKTSLMREVEEKFDNEPLEDLLPRLINEMGHTSYVAKRIRVSKATLGYWLLKFKINVRQVAVRPGEEIFIANDSSIDSVVKVKVTKDNG